MSYLKKILAQPTPQSEAVSNLQIPNNAGGHVFKVDDFGRLSRFLILGAEGNTYYTAERVLVRENAACAERCIKADGARAVKTIVEISDSGRASKNGPALLALALAASAEDSKTRRAALEALPAVARIGTHLFEFVSFIDTLKLRGWGRLLKEAITRWFLDKSPEQLAFQAMKYQQREGWSMRDLLRLVRPTPQPGAMSDVLHWIVKGWDSVGDAEHPDPALRQLWAFERLKRAISLNEAETLIRDYRMPRESVPTQWLTAPRVWAALLPHMGATALIRNLATMTRVGLLAPLSEATKTVQSRLGDVEYLRQGRAHPISLLSASRTYASGRGIKGRNTWVPVPQVTNALDAAFYRAFQNVEPTNKSWLLALDVSGSMSCGEVAGVPGLTPREASAAMALMTASVESRHRLVGFTSSAAWGSTSGSAHGSMYPCGLSPVGIRPGMNLSEATSIVSRMPMGGTDCALPMVIARKEKWEVDAFVVYTDNETWSGDIHPHKALEQYRQAMGRDAKLIVVALLATPFTIANPDDPGMLDVVGFDAAAPAVMADFVRNGL